MATNKLRLATQQSSDLRSIPVHNHQGVSPNCDDGKRYAFVANTGKACALVLRTFCPNIGLWFVRASEFPMGARYRTRSPAYLPKIANTIPTSLSATVSVWSSGISQCRHPTKINEAKQPLSELCELCTLKLGQMYLFQCEFAVLIIEGACVRPSSVGDSKLSRPRHFCTIVNQFDVSVLAFNPCTT